MIQIDYLVLADAVAAVGGKHYIHGGGWDTIAAASFPIVHNAMALAARLRVPWSATNQPCALELDVIDADGRSILPNPPGPLRGTINVGRPPELPAGEDQVLPLAFPLHGLRFERAGTYDIVLRLSNGAEARAPFRVVQAQAAQ